MRNTDKQVTANLLLISLLLVRTRRKKRNPPRFWIRDIYKKRKSQGAFHNLIQEMRLTDSERFINYLRMSSETFDKLLSIVGPSLKKLYHVREPISCAERLTLTLRFVIVISKKVAYSLSFI